MAVSSSKATEHALWRWLPVLAVAGLLLVIYGGATLRGDPPALWWKAMGVPAMEPSFFDASVIGTWFDLRRAGEDPSSQNLLDPLQRTLNYPPTIFLFSSLGWSQESAPIVGLLFALCYLGCIALLTAGVGCREAIYWTLLACAPAGLLAVERANMDILILAFVVLATKWCCTPWASAFLLAATALWKLFAVVGIAALLVGDRTQRIAGTVALLVCVCGFWLMKDSVFTTIGSLAHEASGAFGVNAIANFWIQNANPGDLGEAIRLLSLPAAIVLAIVAVATGFFDRTPSSIESQRDIFGAWLGALLFGALFLSGTQFDYKLLFLWPMVSWVWKKGNAQGNLESKLAKLWLLSLLLCAGWHFFSSDTSWREFFLKQFLVWILFLISAYLGGRLLKSSWQAAAEMRNLFAEHRKPQSNP